MNAKSDTYFMLPEANMDFEFVLPIINKFVSNSRLEVSLLKIFGKTTKAICQENSHNLDIEFKRFNIDYDLEYNLNSTDATAMLKINNPSRAMLRISDIYNSGNIKRENSTKINLPLVSNAKGNAGFCLSLESDYYNKHLKKGSDFFCKSVTLSDDIKEHEIKKIQSADKKEYIQLAKCKDSIECIYPHKKLGIKNYLNLTKAGFEPRAKLGSNATYIVIGPYFKVTAKNKLKEIKKLIPNAKIY
jgi:hypothetical protein